MVTSDDRTASFLSAAARLETWADSLPRWSQDGEEPWHMFLDRLYEAEMAIIERLRRAPGCRLKTCPARMHIRLTLGGIAVSTDQGLAAALRDWASSVREQLGR